MKKITIVVIPEGVHATRQISVPRVLIKVCVFGGLAASACLGFLTFDYLELRAQRQNFAIVHNENQGLKGEARLLMQNLEEVKGSLRRVQYYTSKLGELTSLRVQKVSQETGIGPLTEGEFHASQLPASQSVPPEDYVPLGINMDTLVFKPVFHKLAGINNETQKQLLDLQHLLSTLSQQKSLLSSIPAVSPVDGWITSGFGTRVSPFTCERTLHLGIDIAAPLGSPIHAPADGVVIFSGAKAGFGNFIMLAHGYGVVTCYGHNHQNLVQLGQKVLRGEQIGTVGSSGRTTGPHLHYEIVVNGKTENPRKFILDINEFQVF